MQAVHSHVLSTKEIISYFKCSHWLAPICQMPYTEKKCIWYRSNLLPIHQYSAWNSKYFACDDAPATASLKHSLPAHIYLVGCSSQWPYAYFYYPVERRPGRVPQRDEPTATRLLLNLWLVCDWVGARRRAAVQRRVIAFSLLVGGAFHHFVF
jgi:hypothetical protein